jgi:hypothetical protein
MLAIASIQDDILPLRPWLTLGVDPALPLASGVTQITARGIPATGLERKFRDDALKSRLRPNYGCHVAVSLDVSFSLELFCL